MNVQTEVNWVAVFEEFVAGSKKPEGYFVEFLFELASQLAVMGRYDDKKRVYMGMIYTHPKATQDDQNRVVTYACDLLRREGYAALAQDMLQRAVITPHGQASIDWLMAQVNCLLALGDVKQAIVFQRTLLSRLPADTSLDKQIYYLEMLVHLLLIAGEKGGELDRLLTRMENLVNVPSFHVQHQVRAMESYHRLAGRVWQARGDFVHASSCLSQAFYFPSAPREQVVTGLIHIFCQYQLPASKRSLRLEDVVHICRANLNFLQETDKTGYSHEYEFFLQLLKEREST